MVRRRPGFNSGSRSLSQTHHKCTGSDVTIRLNITHFEEHLEGVAVTQSLRKRPLRHNPERPFQCSLRSVFRTLVLCTIGHGFGVPPVRPTPPHARARPYPPTPLSRSYPPHQILPPPLRERGSGGTPNPITMVYRTFSVLFPRLYPKRKGVTS